MNYHSIRRFVIAASVSLTSIFATLAAATCSQAAPITYTLQPVELSNGYSITGSITTDGAEGALTSANITSWFITGSNGTDTYTITTGSAIVEASDATYALRATPTRLYLPDLPLLASGIVGLLDSHFDIQDTSRHARFEEAVRTENVSSRVFSQHAAWGQDSTVLGSVDVTGDTPLGDLVIATAVVPEPATLTLCGTAVLGLGAFLLVRRQRFGN